MVVEWFKCKGDVWCELNKIDTEHKYLAELDGVYIIWCGDGKDRQVLKVGFGSIRTEILDNKQDIAVQAFKKIGIYVTWAEVSRFSQEGVYSFLIRELDPKFKIEPPKFFKTKVNLPW